MPHPTILLDLQYLPCLQYWTKFIQYKTVLLEQHENFVKSSYRNRCHIAGVNGLLRLSIPLAKGKNEQQNIRQVTLSNQDHWRSRHWHSIRSAYGNAPYWEYYADQFEPYFKTKSTNLFDFNYQLFQTIYQLLGLTAEVQLTAEYQSTPSYDQVLDFRAGIHPKPHRAKKWLSPKSQYPRSTILYRPRSTTFIRTNDMSVFFATCFWLSKQHPSYSSPKNG